MVAENIVLLQVKNCCVESPDLKDEEGRQKAFMQDFSYGVRSVLKHFQSKLYRVNECRTLTEIKQQGINTKL